MKKIYITILSSISLMANSFAQQLPLAGKWQVRLDSTNMGIEEKWWNKTFPDQIELPGTLDDAGIGEKPSLSTDSVYRQIMLTLTRKHRYIGVAWYRKEIEIPASFAGKQTQLYLERVIWKTTAWIDGKKIGEDESLSTPQVFGAPVIPPGKHTIVLRIDNRKQHYLNESGFAHAYTDGTQIIWNGVIGQMKLQTIPATAIEDLQVYPSLKNSEVKFNITLNKAPSSASIKINLTNPDKTTTSITKTAGTLDAGNLFSITIPVRNPQSWDEFTPALYKATVQVLQNDKVIDQQTTSFGIREWSNENAELHLNGRRVFLRGTLECNIFPLTGHPPMTTEGWTKVFSTARQYGLNHLRFHSWCPPEAAFHVADSLGFYLQVELPNWALKLGQDVPTLDFLQSEAQRIIRSYGNHPSFCFWSMGNELEGDFNWLKQMVTSLKRQDPRRLYTSSSMTFQKDHGHWPEPQDDYYIAQYTTKGWVRGQGIFNSVPPDFKTDYTRSIEGFPVPLVTHEIGQYSVYPVMSEIPKYTGVLDPLNFIAVQKDLQKKNMLQNAAAYTHASGKLAALLYKEEIERALKTKGSSGFELLDLHDFPGQGTALVGLLDAFWDSKGLITPEKFREFCSPVTPLIRFEKATYAAQETFHATVEVANFSDKDLQHPEIEWSIKNEKTQQPLSTGKIPIETIPIGSGNILGVIDCRLNTIKNPAALIIEVGIKGTKYTNSWKIWVYPQFENALGNAIFTTSVDEAIQELKKGKCVILNPDTAKIKGVDGRFTTVFWSPVHFPHQPGSMGLWYDENHPALRHFPSDGYSNWQWWNLVTNSRSIVLDDYTNSLTPVINVVDNFFKNRKLAVLIETTLGKGKLLLCTMDLSSKDLPAQALKHSLSEYINSAAFKPQKEISEEALKSLFK